MKLIIALGNPGKKYIETRHNAGFLMADYLQKKLNFPDFKFDKKFNAEISQQIGNNNPVLKYGDNITLVKPQTFMNNSGQSVQALINFYKVPVEEIIVIHDELDLKLGDFKISQNKNASGHNGVLSIFNSLGTKDFQRVRIGIDNRTEEQRKNISGSDYVLARFTKEELKILEDVFENILKELNL